MTYKVIVLSVGSSKNKIFYSGDIVTTEDFEEEEAEGLVRDGFLEEYKEEPKKAKK